VLLWRGAGSGLWIGLSLLAWPWWRWSCSRSRPVGDSMVLTIWGSTSSWTLTALPLFLWMGEILFRTKLSEDMFKGLAPWLGACPAGCCMSTSSAAPSSPRCRARQRRHLRHHRQASRCPS
jgi:C4-dicarboxylate transporter DctM subunit